MFDIRNVICNNKNKGDTMKYLNKLIELGCFTRQDVVKLTGTKEAAHSALHDYLKAGYIERIRRDLYTAISFETKQPIANRFLIASNIAKDAYVSHHSAFEYYGYANQVYYNFYVTTALRFSDFDYDGITYKRLSPTIESGVIVTKTGVRITDIERTVIDGILAFEKIGGLEELLRCLELVPSLRADRLQLYLAEYELAYLYQKTGFILYRFNERFGLPESFFDYCKQNVPQSKKYLYHQKNVDSNHFVFYKDWNLYGPTDIMTIINKGVDFNG